METDPVVLSVMLGGGVLLLVTAFGDAAMTTLGIAEMPGPVTKLLGMTVWRAFRALTSRSESRILRASGPFVTLTVVSAWVLSIWMGWSLVFASVPASVVHADTGDPASFAGKVYFSATSFVTTGVGDFVPSSDVWRVVTGLVSVSGLGLITLAITYLVPVISAAVDRVRLAHLLYSLGHTPFDILRRHWDGAGFTPLVEQMPTLVGEMTGIRAKHLAYPVLHFFHSPDLGRALAPRVAALDEALTILRYAIHDDAAPPAAALEPLREDIDALLSTVVRQAFARPRDEVPPVPALEPLRELGVPVVSDVSFAEAVQSLADRRRKLNSYVLDDSWSWIDVYEDEPAGG